MSHKPSLIQLPSGHSLRFFPPKWSSVPYRPLRTRVLLPYLKRCWLLMSTHLLMLPLLTSYLKLSTRRTEPIHPRQPMFRLQTSHASDPAPVVVFKNISPHVAQAEPDPATTLRPFFAFLPTEVVERTLQATTQYARVPMSESSRRFFKSPFLALNVARRNEDLLTDVVYSDTPAIDNGSTSAAIYSGRISHVMDVYGTKTDKQFVNTLVEDILVFLATTPYSYVNSQPDAKFETLQNLSHPLWSQGMQQSILFMPHVRFFN
jgi:hypothetical protein